MSDQWQPDDFDALLTAALRARPEPLAPPDLASQAIERTTATPPIVVPTARWRSLSAVAACVAIAVLLIVGGTRLSRNVAAITAAEQAMDAAADTSTTSAASSTSSSSTDSSSTNAMSLLIGGGLLVLVVGTLALDRMLGSNDEPTLAPQLAMR